MKNYNKLFTWLMIVLAAIGFALVVWGFVGGWETKNALASAFEQLSEVALENISDKINKESYYIRVAAGTEFYLYIEQVINIEKAAIAETALNQLAQFKQAQKKTRNNSEDELSRLHESLGRAIPRSLKKELQLKGL